MKKLLKRTVLISIITVGFVLPGFADDGEISKDASFLCKYFPSLCSVERRGAGGSGHGCKPTGC